MSWMILWKWVLVICVSLYGILALVVAIFGVRDVASMLKELSGSGEVSD